MMPDDAMATVAVTTEPDSQDTDAAKAGSFGAPVYIVVVLTNSCVYCTGLPSRC